MRISKEMIDVLESLNASVKSEGIRFTEEYENLDPNEKTNDFAYIGGMIRSMVATSQSIQDFVKHLNNLE